jgi:hypothetical protein
MRYQTASTLSKMFSALAIRMTPIRRCSRPAEAPEAPTLVASALWEASDWPLEQDARAAPRSREPTERPVSFNPPDNSRPTPLSFRSKAEESAVAFLSLPLWHLGLAWGFSPTNQANGRRGFSPGFSLNPPKQTHSPPSSNHPSPKTICTLIN